MDCMSKHLSSSSDLDIRIATILMFQADAFTHFFKRTAFRYRLKKLRNSNLRTLKVRLSIVIILTCSKKILSYRVGL